MSPVRQLARLLPLRVRRFLGARRRPYRAVRWGSLRRLTPLSRAFGLDRGRCIDRYYIEQFLQQHRADIRGHVMEVGERTYTTRYGGDRVTRADVLHAVAGNPQATLVGDLVAGTGIPRDRFDCILIPQTFPFIFDLAPAIAHTRAALKPGGVMLATLPGVCQISRHDMDRWGDFWRFTDASAARLFGDAFGAGNVAVRAHGNVLVACAFLQGMAAEELTPEELDYRDADYPVLLTVRAVRA